MNIDTDTIRVIPHGTGQLKSGIARTFPSSEKWRIGYITKYGVQKDFESLIAAVSILDNGGHDVQLVLTLDESTTEYSRVDRLVSKYGVHNILENYGELGPDSVQQLYDSLDVFVFPSLCESFGFPLVEAMACGLPVIVSDTVSNREIADKAGLFFRSGDAEELAGNVLQVMGNAAVYRHQSEASLKQASEFDWKKAANDTVDEIEELVNETKL
jgi:glycosyltransferase involved in cell wall biosynthesis